MRAKEKTGHVFMHRLEDARARFGIARANSRCSQQGKAPELVEPHTRPHFPISTTCQCSLRSCSLSQVPHPTPPLPLPLPRRASLSCLFLKSICKAAAFRLAPTCYVGEAAAVVTVLCLAPAQLPILHPSHRYFTIHCPVPIHVPGDVTQPSKVAHKLSLPPHHRRGRKRRVPIVMRHSVAD